MIFKKLSMKLIIKNFIFIVLFLFSYHIFIGVKYFYSYIYDIKSNEILDNFIFIGGYGRSGTTLMRAILDAHPNIRCGPETKLIPDVLNYKNKIYSNKLMLSQIYDAGLTDKTINGAIASFIRSIIYDNGEEAIRYCNKDPHNARHISYLKSIFPNMKFIFMIRDPRASIFSYVDRIYKKGDDLSAYRLHFKRWNDFIKIALKECEIAGPDYCLKVRYEYLVTDPKKVIKKVINFLGEKWSDSLMNHQDFVGSKIKVSNSEWSTDQIKNEINTNATNAWVGQIPKVILDEIKYLAPLATSLGYNLNKNSSF